MRNLTEQDLKGYVGEPLAGMVNLDLANHYLRDALEDGISLGPEEVAIARALMNVVSGSALLDGDAKALKDASTLYRLVCCANNLLIGRLVQQLNPTEGVAPNALLGNPIKKEGR